MNTNDGSVTPIGIPFVVTTAVVLAMLLYYIWPVDRSLFMEATTEEANVTLESDVLWRMNGAVLCRSVAARRGDPKLVASETTCGDTETVANPNIERLELQMDAILSLRRNGQERPYIQVISPSLSEAKGLMTTVLEEDDRIILPDDFGPFSAVGSLALGPAPSSGRFLISGTYEWRERLPFRKRRDVTDSGKFHAGDQVFASEGDCLEKSSGDMLLYSSPDEDDGLGVVFGASDAEPSRKGAVVLCLSRHGFAETQVKPSLIGRIVSDPVIYGVGLVLAILAIVFPTVVVLLELLNRQIHRNKTDAKEEPIAKAKAIKAGEKTEESSTEEA